MMDCEECEFEFDDLIFDDDEKHRCKDCSYDYHYNNLSKHEKKVH
jgi:hypothetical protein